MLQGASLSNFFPFGGNMTKKPQKRSPEEDEQEAPAAEQAPPASTDEITPDPAPEVSAAKVEAPVVPPDTPSAPAEEVPEEVSQLQAAVEKIRTRMAWHEEQIKLHRAASDRLFSSLQQQLGLLGLEEQPPPEEEPGITARQLILDFIKEQGGVASNQDIKEFFEKKNRRSNPSVELSRMVSEGVLTRPGRGSYATPKKK